MLYCQYKMKCETVTIFNKLKEKEPMTGELENKKRNTRDILFKRQLEKRKLSPI